MPIFHQIIDFFRSHHSKNNNKKTGSNSTAVAIKKKENPVEISSPPTTSSISRKTPSNYSQLPELEFEQSRHLLELDFFHIDDDDHRQSSLITTFPQFEHLLQPPQQQQQEDDQQKTTSLNRNLTRTLRHRISMYRPHTKTVKRAISTPQLYNHNQ